MNNTIGLLMDDKDRITDLFHMSHVDIHQLKEEWEVVQTYDIPLMDTTSTGMLRKSIEALADRLDTCKILIGTSIIGIPYHILDRNGFVLCEAEELDKKLLDQVYEDYCKEKKVESEESEEPVESVSTGPRPIDNEGNFFLDFIKVQRYRPEISSKKALLPFLSHELFQTLTIVCSHIMPWLEDFVQDRGQKMDSKREDGRYIVVISRL